MDRPTNLMVINSVELFDEPPDWERVNQIIQSPSRRPLPAFSPAGGREPPPAAPPRWEDDPDFALEHHVHHFALPAPGDRAALQELVGDLMTMPLDRNRPLWQTYLVDGFGEGAAIINRMHHCIADGIALARVMLSLTDSDSDVGIASPLPEPPRPPSARLLPGLAGSTERFLAGAGHAGAAAVRHGAGLLDLTLARREPGRRDRSRRRGRGPTAPDPGRHGQPDQGRSGPQPACGLGRAALAETGSSRSRTRKTPPSTTFSWPL